MLTERFRTLSPFLMCLNLPVSFQCWTNTNKFVLLHVETALDMQANSYSMPSIPAQIRLVNLHGHASLSKVSFIQFLIAGFNRENLFFVVVFFFF